MADRSVRAFALVGIIAGFAYSSGGLDAVAWYGFGGVCYAVLQPYAASDGGED